MSIADKLTTIAENVPKVYEAGQKSMVDESKIIPKTITGSSRVLSAYDVSEIPHKVSCKLASDTITDFTGCSVEVHGKNLWNKDTAKLSIANATLVEQLENGYCLRGNYKEGENSNAWGNGWLSFEDILHLELGDIIAISADYTILELHESRAVDDDIGIYCYGAQSMSNGILYDGVPEVGKKERISYTYVIQKTGLYKPVFTLNSNLVKIENIQIEYNSLPTNFEPYVSILYPANADGTVEGIASISNAMSLVSSGDIVVSEMSYNKSWSMNEEQLQTWKRVTANGKRKSFNQFFRTADWTGYEFIKPVVPVEIDQIFQDYRGVKLPKNLDFSKVVHRSNQTSNLCYGATMLVEFPDLKMPAPTTQHWYDFTDCLKLKTIEVFRCVETAKFVSTFAYCYELVNITFEGVIGQNGLDLHWSTKLSKTSIENIIEHLSTTASGMTVTLSKTAVNNAFTTDEWNTLVASRSNWTIALA
jgi:hypothetical protein